MHVFGERKNLCSSKSVQLLLLNRAKTRLSENRAAQGFHYINSFISNIFGPNSKTCTCEVRAAWGRVSRGLTVQVQYMKIPSSEHEEIMMCTEFFFDIQNNLCTQHALPMFCKNKSFWQRFTCNIVKLQIAGHLPIVTEIMKYHPCLYVY